MDIGFIPPILDILPGRLLDLHLLARLAESDNQKDLVSFRDLQGLSQSVPLNGTDHAAAELLLGSAQEDALGRDPVIAAKAGRNLRVA